jgi:hypothetical protein
MRTSLSMLVLIATAVIAVKIGAPELIRAQFGALAPLVSGVRFLVPGLGGHLASIIPGAAGVPLYRFLWCTALATSVVAMGWTFPGVCVGQLQG